MPPKILAIVPDLMVASRIQEAVKLIGASVSVESALGDFSERVEERPDLIVVDLGIPGLNLDAVVEAGRSGDVPVMAFYPHVDVELRRAARRAGIEHVYPRSRFLRETAGLLGKVLGKSEG